MNLEVAGVDQSEKHKVFVSFHHDDEKYRQEFEQRYATDFISVSVDPGDIDPDSNDEYIKRLIQEDNIVQSSVTAALYGAKTYGRKHVDWEIYGALTEKVGGHKGLVVMLLPGFPQSPFNASGEYDPSLIYPYLHPRTVANLKSGYADLYFWPGLYENPLVQAVAMKDIIEKAFTKRKTHDHLIDNSHPQYSDNLS